MPGGLPAACVGWMVPLLCAMAQLLWQLLRQAASCPLYCRRYRTGTANIGAANCSRNTFDSQNTLLTWGPTVARTYQADYQVVAWPGASLGLHIKRQAGRWLS